MGRPPKPNGLKRRLGNPWKRALPERAPAQTVVGEGAIPAAPAGLKKHGKAAWARLWSVGPAWLNATTDRALLTRLCQAYDEREQLRRLVGKYGHLVAKVIEEDEVDDPGRGGTRTSRVYEIKANPAVIQLRKLEELITRYEGLCGFTPSDRSRLGMAEVKRESALEQFLKGSRRQRDRDDVDAGGRPGGSDAGDGPIVFDYEAGED